MRGGGFEVYIAKEDGTPHEEYRIEEEEGSLEGSVKMSCYLEAEEGKTFKIVLKRHATPEDHAWGVKPKVDGRRITKRALAGDFKEYTVAHMCYKEGGEVWQGRLTFATVETTDLDDEMSIQQKQLDKLGTIRVEFWRGTKCRRSKGTILTVDRTVGVAHERSKKMDSCAIATQVERIDATTGTVGFDYLDKRAFHIFTFRYRCRPVLEKMNILKPLVQQDVHRPMAQVSRKRKRADVEAEDEDEDEKPHAKQFKELQRQVEYWKRMATSGQHANGRKKDMIDLSIDSDEE